MKDSPRASFTAADAMPIKLLQHHGLIRNITQNKIIPPLHVQLIPTNRCNLKCSFCSCENENRSIEMTRRQVIEIIAQLRQLGTEGVTITGGGEPLLYEGINALILQLAQSGIKSGLVTNGVLLARQNANILNLLTWCRISQGDAREKWTDGFLLRLSGIIDSAHDVGWAFSYVVSQNPNIDKIRKIIRFANEHNFTHVRLVADLLCTDKVPMDYVQEELQSSLVPIIFQDRKQPEKGNNCRVCYLRPVITPDNKIYACCGAQYALAKPTLNFPPELCLGEVKDFSEIISKSSQPFEGAKNCEYCYYGNYNRTLDMLMTETQHKEFI